MPFRADYETNDNVFFKSNFTTYGSVFFQITPLMFNWINIYDDDDANDSFLKKKSLSVDKMS